MRTLQKIIKRSGLPIEYSQGFNPHMSISIAQPLSVGMYSKGEYMDVIFKEPLSSFYIKDKLNESSPRAIRFIEVVKIRQIEGNEKKIPQSMAAVDGARYSITIKYKDASKIHEEIKALPKMKQWNIIKKGKSGEKEVDIRPMLKEFKYKVEGNNLNLQVLVSCGSRENLSADLLSKFVQENTSNADLDAFVQIQREEMYALENKKYVPLYKFLGNR